MNDCGNAIMRDRLPDLLHERLGDRERAELEAHLAVCADCRTERELLRATAAALIVGRPVDSAVIARALPARIRDRTRRRVWRRVAAAAASIAIVAAGSFALLDRGTEPAPRVASGDSLLPSPGDAAPPIVAATPSGPEPAASAALLPVGASLGELSDSQLAALLASLESLDALPSIEPRSVLPAVPLNGEEG